MKTVEIRVHHKDKNNRPYCEFKCHCGELFIAQRSNVRSGQTKGCGCLRGKDSLHGHYRGNVASRTYRTWQSMLERCYNPSKDNYRHYGGRGILVCQSWHYFPYFLEDMGIRPEGMTLDRIDNEKGYYPDNCKWSTPKEQANNRRKRRVS